MNNSILPGVAVNQDEVVRSLKERGFYSSGIPRTSCDVAPPARERAAVPKKKKRVIAPVWRPTRDQRRYMSPEDFQAYINHAKREEGNNPHG